jgi:beta-glucanase (GH16 family)
MTNLSQLLFALFLISYTSLSAQCDYTIGDLVWSDEFDYTGLPDSDKWGYDVGGGGWGNNEDQYYTENRTENARVENGHLIIEARKESYENREYTSARLVTRGKGDWLYGRIEVMAKIPVEAGTWPAIWTLPTDWEYGGWPASGEMDIMESFTAWGIDRTGIHANIHTEAYNHMNGTNKGDHIGDLSDISDNFHLYAVDWYPDRMEFSVDNQYFFTFENEGNWQAWPYDKRFHLILNIAIGGTGGGWIDDSKFNHQMIVDYVRVYDLRAIGESQPYDGVAQEIPGVLEMEHYDEGCEGGSYADNTGGNTGGALRTNDVDIEACEEGGYNVGWIEENEWLTYTVNVTKTGLYELNARVASDESGGSFHVKVDGVDLTGSVNVTGTGGWQSWETIAAGEVNLESGQHTIEVYMENGPFNFNSIEFVESITALMSEAEEEVSIYPNPVENQIFIDSNMDFEEYELVNTLGKSVLSGKVSGNMIPLQETFPPGVFTLNLIDPKKANQITRQVIVK